MSRTEKTRPWRVKVEEYKLLYPRYEEPRPGWTYWTYEWWRGEFRCGCKMCGWDAFETPRRKRERMEGKRLCRNWQQEYE